MLNFSRPNRGSAELSPLPIRALVVAALGVASIWMPACSGSSRRNGQATDPCTVTLLGHCKGFSLGGNMVITAAHCIPLPSELKCLSHPSAAPGLGTDIALCSIRGAEPSAKNRCRVAASTPESVRVKVGEGRKSFLLRRVGAELVGKAAISELCSGTSGAPAFNSEGEAGAIYSSRSSSCNEAGAAHFVPIATLSSWFSFAAGELLRKQQE